MGRHPGADLYTALRSNYLSAQDSMQMPRPRKYFNDAIKKHKSMAILLLLLY